MRRRAWPPTEPRATAAEGSHITEEQVDQAIAWVKGQQSVSAVAADPARSPG